MEHQQAGAYGVLSKKQFAPHYINMTDDDKKEAHVK